MATGKKLDVVIRQVFICELDAFIDLFGSHDSNI